MGSNISDHQLNVDYCMQKMLYVNLMVTRNQKLIIDTQKIKREKSKHKTKEEDKKKGTEKNYKNKHNTSNKMAISTYLSINSFKCK